MNAVEGARKDGRAKGGEEWGTQLQIDGAGVGWGAVRETERFPEQLGRTEAPAHCLGWRPRVFGEQGSDPEAAQARGLRGRRLGGDSLGLGSLTEGARRLQDREGRAGRGSRGDRRRPRSGLCSRSRPEPSEPGGAQNGEEGREGQRRGGGGREEAPPHPQTGRPASGAPWWGQAGCLCEMGARAGFPSCIQTPPPSPFLTWEQQ